jgi:hypothetical protein
LKLLTVKYNFSKHGKHLIKSITISASTSRSFIAKILTLHTTVSKPLTMRRPLIK